MGNLYLSYFELQFFPPIFKLLLTQLYHLVSSAVSEFLSKEELEDEIAKAEKAIDQVLKIEQKKNVEREKNRLAKGILTYMKKYKTTKKSVKWLPDKELTSVRFFELDETERGTVFDLLLTTLPLPKGVKFIQYYMCLDSSALEQILNVSLQANLYTTYSPNN